MDGITKEEKKTQIYQVLKQFIIDIIGEDVAEEIEITPKSAFTKDLEMDSIEIVAFAEKVKAKYGDGIDFTTWLSEMDLDDLINLKIEDIINYIADEYSGN